MRLLFGSGSIEDIEGVLETESLWISHLQGLSVVLKARWNVWSLRFTGGS
jgi:hypothetical protein